MKLKLFVALLGFGLAGAIAHGQDAGTDLTSSLDNWKLNTPMGSSTLSIITPTDTTATNLLFPTNDARSWQPFFLDPASSSISTDGDALKVVIGKNDDKPWHSSLLQRFVPLVNGQDYVLTFRAKADIARAISPEFQIGGGDWHTVGLVKDAALTTDWQSFSFPFTASKVTSDGVQLSVRVGEQSGIVWLADMKLSPASGAAPVPAPATALRVDVTQAITPGWKIMLASKHKNLVEGQKYLLSYSIESDKPRSMYIDPQIDSDDYHPVGKGNFTISAGPVWRNYSTTFVAQNTKPNDITLVFPLGQVTGTVCVGDVKLTAVN